MRTRIDKYLNRINKRGKQTSLSYLERFVLHFTGKRDANFGLPNEDTDGTWTSPIIQRELNACNEAHNKIYGTLQTLLEDKYRTASELAEMIEFLEASGEKLKKEMPELPVIDGVFIRKHGEENLTDMQVQSRRMREYSKATSELTARIEEIEKELDTSYRKLIELKSYLQQKNNEADLACRRIRCHTQQRIDYYWNAAFHSSYERKRCIPVTFGLLPIPNVVQAYRKMFGIQEEKINKVLDMYKCLKEVA